MSGKFNPYETWLGIPPAEQPPDHYRLLGVARFEKHRPTIEAAAKGRVQHLQSHQAGDQAEACRRLLLEIGAARACLIDEDRRAAYDRNLAAERPVASREPAASMAQPQLSAAEFLDLLQRDHPISAGMLAAVRKRLAESKVAISAAKVADALVAKGALSREVADRLLAKKLLASKRELVKPEPSKPALAKPEPHPADAAKPEPVKPEPVKPELVKTTASWLDDELPPMEALPVLPSLPSLAPMSGGGDAMNSLFDDPALAGPAQEPGTSAAGPLMPLQAKPGSLGFFGGRPARGRGPWEKPVTWIGIGAAAGLLLAGVIALGSLLRADGDSLCRQADRLYEADNYDDALSTYGDFLDRFPQHSQSGRARVRQGLCQLALAVKQGTDLPTAYRTAADVIERQRAEPWFAVEAPPKLAVLLPPLAKRLADDARKRGKPETLEQAWQVLDLIREHLADVNLQSERLDKIELSLGLTARAIALGVNPDAAAAPAPLTSPPLPEPESPVAQPSDDSSPAEDKKPQDTKPPLESVADASTPTERPLYEQDAFDVITLNRQNDGTVLKVKPLPLPERRLPDERKPGDKLTIELLDRPEKTFELPWEAIEKVELFEQLVLAKGNELLAAERLDESYEYFRFLEANHPQLAGVAAAVESQLYEEAKALHRRHDYRGALARLIELRRRNPQRNGLDRATGAATEKLVEQYVADQTVPPARKLIRDLAAAFPDHPAIAAWESRWRKQAAALLPEAQAAVADKQWEKASALCRQIESVWPATAGAKELAAAVHEKYPRITVGVVSQAGNAEFNPIGDWASRRSVSLLGRPAIDAAGPYVVEQRRASETLYRPNPKSDAEGPGEVVEQCFVDDVAAAVALCNGRIDALDRVGARQLAKLKADQSVVVQAYARPLIHALIANLRKPLTADRDFRRAMAYGVHRQALLDRLLADNAIADCRTVNTLAPGPAGNAPGDTREASGDRREYDPQLAAVLAEAACRKVESEQAERGRQGKLSRTLVLAHPGDVTARAACAQIRRQLGLIGIVVQLRESPHVPWPLPDDVDLLYAELAVWDLPGDVVQVLGDGGPGGGCTPAMGLALRRLAEAGDPAKTQAAMREVERVIHVDAVLLPLWQSVDHFAYRAAVKGIGQNPTTLYQNVQQWRRPFNWAGEDARLGITGETVSKKK